MIMIYWSITEKISVQQDFYKFEGKMKATNEELINYI